MEFEKAFSVNKTNIPGVLLIDIPVHGDKRGWFKENFQREKMVSLGLPDIKIVQNNVSFNSKRGTTRGIHAEPWDKFISVATGSIFGAWVDLRPGDSFGEVFTCVLDPSKAVFVPRGVGNSFQALEDDTSYTYLVNDHWSEESKENYTFVNLADPDLNIQWPISLIEAELSDSDKNHPFLSEIEPMLPKTILIIGAKGQLGHELTSIYEERGDFIECVDIDEFDISDPNDYEKMDWNSYSYVINACAYTAVDASETDEGRVTAWKVNAAGPALLAKKAIEHDFILIHVSSDYVFDGTSDIHNTDEPFSPLNVYGASKAAGDIAVSVVPKHFIVRTSWMIGRGHNFVKTMIKLSDRCADVDDDLCHVNVVDDQFGRLTFAEDLARFIVFLVDENPSFGTYNFSNPGTVVSWNDIARKVFEIRNENEDCIYPICSKKFNSQMDYKVAERPSHSSLVLDDELLDQFKIRDWNDVLFDYVNKIER